MRGGVIAHDHFEGTHVPVIETPNLYLRHLSLEPGRTAESVLSDPEVIQEHQAIADFITEYWVSRFELDSGEAETYKSFMRRPESMLPLIDIAQKFRAYEQKLHATDNHLPLPERIEIVQGISRTIDQVFAELHIGNPQESLVMLNHYHFVNRYCKLGDDIAEMTRSDTARLWDVVMRPEVMDSYVDTDGTQYVPLPLQMSDGGVYWTQERTAELIGKNQNSWDVYGYGRWGIIEKASARMIGMSGPNMFGWLPSVTGDVSRLPAGAVKPVEVSFRLHPDWHNRGYGTEAGLAVTDMLFRDHPEVEYMYGNTVPENIPSLRTLAKLGLKVLTTESYSRQHTRRARLGSEMLTRFVVHGISREEWETSSAGRVPIISIDGVPYAA